MVPPLKEENSLLHVDAIPSDEGAKIPGKETSADGKVHVSFSHVQLYVNHLDELISYKRLEDSLNVFYSSTTYCQSMPVQERRNLWHQIASIADGLPSVEQFVPQNRDVVKQLIVGFGFRVTGEHRGGTTYSVLLTSKDPSGVQILVTTPRDGIGTNDNQYSHFSADNVHTFLQNHAGCEGIAVLGFHASGIDLIRERYKTKHPKLFHSFEVYRDAQVLEVYAYYQSRGDDVEVKKPDVGRMMRFIETKHANAGGFCVVPGMVPVEAKFDNTSQPAYCDHWVSNVFSRTEFLQTLEETLGFTPKVDFNAGVVAAGEAQIESTVTGNKSDFAAENRGAALRDQSQVYLPINNALSEVGHVHGFLKQLGQGIQHVASRVDNLVDFVQRCNEIRDVTGEGFTFLSIPRSYYGVLSSDLLVTFARIPVDVADEVVKAAHRSDIVATDGSVNLNISKQDVESRLMDQIGSIDPLLSGKIGSIADAVLKSRYANLFSLLRNHVGEDTYLGIVRNQILVDVQGDDILYQIFTCNILQKEASDEAPFFEFIQRVCSECDTESGCKGAIKPGCGGFGIRNFLTLFLSIEVSKAMMEASEAKLEGNEELYQYAQKRVGCFTDQLNESNPILTAISDAMTEEGHCKEEMDSALLISDWALAKAWEVKLNEATEKKLAGNNRLMACSAKYQDLMRAIRMAAARKEEISHLE